MEKTPETHADAVYDNDAADADFESRKSGYMLAVAVNTPRERTSAIEILGERAQLLEEAEGNLQDGDWTDFDPLAPGNVIR